MTGPGSALEGLLACREKAYGATQRIGRCFRHDQMCDMHGVERSAEQRSPPPGHAAQGVEGVDGVALESAPAGQLRARPVALG